MESDLPRRRHTDWMSQQDQGVGLPTEGISSPNAETGMDVFEEMNAKETIGTMPVVVKDGVRLGSGGRRWNRMSSGPAAAEFPRRHPPFSSTLLRSGGHDHELPPTSSHASGAKGEIVVGSGFLSGKDEHIGLGRKANLLSSLIQIRLTREPNESDILRRRPTGWVSQPVPCSNLDVDLLWRGGTERDMDGASDKNEEEANCDTGEDKRNGEGRLGSGGTWRGYKEVGTAPADLPRRRSPYVWPLAQSGGDNNGLPLSPLPKVESDKEGPSRSVVCFGGDGVGDVNSQNNHGTRRDSINAQLFSLTTYVRRKNQPVESDVPHRRREGLISPLSDTLEPREDERIGSGADACVDELSGKHSVGKGATGPVKANEIRRPVKAADRSRCYSPYIPAPSRLSGIRVGLALSPVYDGNEEGTTVARSINSNEASSSDVRSSYGDRDTSSNDGNVVNSASSKKRVKRKQEPVENDVPRRRPDGWTLLPHRSQHQTVVSIPGSGTEADVASFKENLGEKAAELEAGKGNGAGRAGTGVRLCASMNAGAIANDLPRRRPPQALTPKQPSGTQKSSPLHRLQGGEEGLGPGVTAENRTEGDAGRCHYDFFNNANNQKSTTPGEWVRRKREPIESNYPRRNSIGMISQSESDRDPHADRTSSSDADTCIDALNIQKRTKALVLGFAEGAHTERLGSGDGRWGRNGRGAKAVDLPRRRSPYVLASMNTGSKKDGQYSSTARSDGGGGPGVVELGVSTQADARDVDGVFNNHLISDGTSEASTASGDRTQCEREPIDSDSPRRTHIYFQVDMGHGRHADGVSTDRGCTGTGFGGVTDQNGIETVQTGPVKNAGIGRFRSGNVRGRRRKGGARAIDLPRRRFQFLVTSTQLVSDDDGAALVSLGEDTGDPRTAQSPIASNNDDPRDVHGTRTHCAASDGNFRISPLCRKGAGRVQKPIESDIPHRRSTNCTSQTSHGLEIVEEGMSSGGNDVKIVAEIVVVGRVNDAKTRGSWSGVLWHRKSEGSIATAFPRRRPSPYSGTSTHSGSRNGDLHVVSLHEGGDEKEGVVESKLYNTNGAESLDNPHDDRASIESGKPDSTWLRKRVRHKDKPLESDEPRRRTSDSVSHVY